MLAIGRETVRVTRGGRSAIFVEEDVEVGGEYVNGVGGAGGRGSGGELDEDEDADGLQS